MIIYFREALNNIRVTFWLNSAVVAIIVAVMTFLGIILIQVRISDLTADVVLKQEAFVELSQYRFWVDGDAFNRLLYRRDLNVKGLLS